MLNEWLWVLATMSENSLFQAHKTLVCTRGGDTLPRKLQNPVLLLPLCPYCRGQSLDHKDEKGPTMAPHMSRTLIPVPKSIDTPNHQPETGLALPGSDYCVAQD